MDDTIREMLLKGHSSDEIKQYACQHNHMVTLREDIAQKFTSGLTTLEEVFRVTIGD
jgi:type II secretory ATPase GspE/PulE/Tfp pilus assembly ATPase PilB-like protein